MQQADVEFGHLEHGLVYVPITAWDMQSINNHMVPVICIHNTTIDINHKYTHHI